MGRYCTEHMIPQMKELINNYNPDILYGDGDWDFLSKVYQTPSFFKWLFNESPVKDSIVINDRWGKETRGKHGGYYTTEYDTLKKLTDNVENSSFTKVWEECRGIGASFGYNKNENLEDYSSSEQLIHILINKVSRGGNLLLNIGPTADGRIPVIMQQRLCNQVFYFYFYSIILKFHFFYVSISIFCFLISYQMYR
jgi:alpha-L-fucosidase